ncbi:MAG: hypothetical protein ABI383_00940 [Acidobacteriaceae bacterium]
MNIEEIIQQLRSERGRIDAAIAALEGSRTGATRGRRPGKAAKPIAGAKRRGRPAMSEAERKRLSVQMKKRWAERKAAQAKAAKA